LAELHVNGHPPIFNPEELSGVVTNKRWHILGAGAMGCLFAGALREAGQEVTLLLRDKPVAPELPLVIEERGSRKEFRVDASAAADRSAISHLLVCTKAYDVTEAVESVAHRLDKDSRVLLLANGMGFAETLRKRLPHLDLYCGMTTEGAYQLGPRKICHAGRGQTRVGQAGMAKPAPWFAQWENAVPDSLWDANIEQALWLKLAINCAINPLTAIHRCPNGELLGNPDLDQQVQQLCSEIEQVSRAAGMGDALGGLHSSVAEVIQGTAANRSSMLQDVLAGRPTEIDYITGYLLELASRHGVPTPHNTAILDKIRSLHA